MAALCIMTTMLATGKRGRVQALQVQLIHAVNCRGGKCNLALLETPAVVEAMVLMGTRHSLLHWIKRFSGNFVVTDNIIGARPVIELVGRGVCDKSIVVHLVGCTKLPGRIARHIPGLYNLWTQHLGRLTYKKAGGPAGYIYFDDGSDRPEDSGWWFGPKMNKLDAWAFHPDRSARMPPKTGWHVPPTEQQEDPSLYFEYSDEDVEAGDTKDENQEHYEVGVDEEYQS